MEFSVLRENPKIIDKGTINYGVVCRRCLENEIMYVMQRVGLRIIIAELIVCRKYMTQPKGDPSKIWEEASKAAVDNGADWLVSEADVKKLKPDWFVDQEGRPVRRDSR